MAEKNGYEIRTDLLHLAYELLKHNADMRYTAAENDRSRIEGSQPVAYEPFNVEDVIKAAESLNEFVQKK